MFPFRRHSRYRCLEKTAGNIIKSLCRAGRGFECVFLGVDRERFLILVVTLAFLCCFGLARGSRLSDGPMTPGKLATMIVSPVRAPAIPISIMQSLTKFCIVSIKIQVGAPKAILSTLIVFPEKRGRKLHNEAADCSAPMRNNRKKGLVLLLPGYGMSKSFLLPYADRLAQAGLVVAMIDLRAQGASTGEHIGYGKREAMDLTQLVQVLRNRLRPTSIGIFGISYGAAVALDAAALMPRIKAVVAVAPYARVEPAIRAFIKLKVPREAADISSATLKHALVMAGQVVGYKLSRSDPLRWVSKIKAHVLYIAGGKDGIVPLSGIKALSKRTAQSRLVVLPSQNHVLLATDTKALKRYSMAWFRRFLSSEG